MKQLKWVLPLFKDRHGGMVYSPNPLQMDLVAARKIFESPSSRNELCVFHSFTVT
jgi:hypothetical protein